MLQYTNTARPGAAAWLRHGQLDQPDTGAHQQCKETSPLAWLSLKAMVRPYVCFGKIGCSVDSLRPHWDWSWRTADRSHPRADMALNWNEGCKCWPVLPQSSKCKSATGPA